MPATKTFTVDSIGDPEPIQVVSSCRKVVIREDVSVSGWPTVEFNVMAPLQASPKVRYTNGESMSLVAENKGYFKVGSIIGYIEAVSGSALFSQLESE